MHKSIKMNIISIIFVVIFATVHAIPHENKQISSKSDILIHEVNGFQFPIPIETSGAIFQRTKSPSNHNQVADSGIHRRRFAFAFEKIPNWLKSFRKTSNKPNSKPTFPAPDIPFPQNTTQQ